MGCETVVSHPIEHQSDVAMIDLQMPKLEGVDIPRYGTA